MSEKDFILLGISLGLGLLVGLQRESSESRVAGIRTFSLVTLFGTLTGLMARQFENIWIIGLGLVSLSLLLFIANFLKSKLDPPSVGQTTEVAALLMFVLGAYLVEGEKIIAVVLGGAVAVLLFLKDTLADFTDRLAEKDLRAIFQFVAISMVVLPVLPGTDFGPYNVLNLREIWLMVVLIVGLSVVGYFAFKWMGKNKGTLMNGILGGLISSTATTLTYSRRTSDIPKIAKLAAFIIMTASTVSFIRVIIEVAVVTPNNIGTLAPPLAAMAVAMAAISAWMYFSSSGEVEKIPEPDNPAQLKSAIIFGLLYALILLAVAFTKDKLGEEGLYVVSVVSGLTDMDAITLSLSNTINSGNLEPSTGWKLILVAGMSNMVFKGGMALTIAGGNIKKFILTSFGLSLAAGLAILFLWPW